MQSEVETILNLFLILFHF